LIYNPNSGDGGFKNDLDSAILEFQNGGYKVEILRATNHGDIEQYISEMPNNFESIVSAGGDGTLNVVINAVKRYGIQAKIGIIPSGTANDFANFIGIPKSVQEASRVIGQGKSRKCDLGQANGKYFINVCAAGLLANVSHRVDENIKSSLGTLAYYLKGIEQLPNFVPMKMKIRNTKEEIIEDLYFFVVLNSAGTGGFSKLSKEAEIDDGLFDFIGFKALNILELAVLFVKVVKGDYLEDDGIIFFRDSEIEVEYLKNSGDDELQADLDGELGPNLPIEIKNIKQSIEIYVP